MEHGSVGYRMLKCYHLVPQPMCPGDSGLCSRGYQSRGITESGCLEQANSALGTAAHSGCFRARNSVNVLCL